MAARCVSFAVGVALKQSVPYFLLEEFRRRERRGIEIDRGVPILVALLWPQGYLLLRGEDQRFGNGLATARELGCPVIDWRCYWHCWRPSVAKHEAPEALR
jgi:hypothetical protein